MPELTLPQTVGELTAAPPVMMYHIAKAIATREPT